MSAVGRVVGVAFFGLLGAAALGYGLRRLRRAYRAVRAETTAVAALANVSGPVEVAGTAAVYEETVEAPFGGEPSLAVEWSVSETRPDPDDGGTEWRTVARGAGAVPFLVDDGSASVLVDPEGADLSLAAGTRLDVDAGESPPDRVAAFVGSNPEVDGQAHGVALGPVRVASSDRRYHERRLDPGETVYLQGTPTYAPGLSDRAGQVNARLDAAAVDLFVSDRGEDATVRSLAVGGGLAAGLGVLLLVLAAGFLVGDVVVG